MSKQKQELFVSANESAVILQQFMGRPRFISFVKEAIEHLEDLQYVEWSPELLADYVSNEMKKPCWNHKQPTLIEFETMVK